MDKSPRTEFSFLLPSINRGRNAATPYIVLSTCIEYYVRDIALYKCQCYSITHHDPTELLLDISIDLNEHVLRIDTEYIVSP